MSGPTAPFVVPRRRVRKITGRAVVVAVLAALVLVPVSAQPAQASVETLEWEDGSPVTTFGANEAVSIAFGTIRFLCDTFFATADVYVVQGVPAAGATLTDVSGAANTVFGTSGGLFTDTIGYTKPAGNLGNGTYTVVYDECQDGKYDAAQDAVFANAFSVELPANIPPASSAILDFKLNALKQADTWRATIAGYDLLLSLEKLEILLKCLLLDPTACVDAFATDYITNELAGELNPADKVKEEARDAMADAFKHWDAIAADPPDPSFNQPTLLPARPRLHPVTDAPLDVAEVRLGAAAANEAALGAGLLHAIERYQGADVAGSGGWALVHAREAQSHATALAAQLADSNAAAGAMRTALAADTRPLDTLATAVTSARTGILAAGLSQPTLQQLSSLGVTPTELNAAMAALDALHPAGFTKAGMLAALDAQVAANSAAIPGLLSGATKLGQLATGLAADPAVLDVTPVADAGGPYAAVEGVSLSLDASGSTDDDSAITAFAWDLDGDAQFDDATGVSPAVSFAQDGSRVIGVRAQDAAGHIGVDYTTVTVSGVNAPPHITATSPSGSTAVLEVGTAASFSVSASDGEGDPVTFAWELDGSPVSTTGAFGFTPASADVGVHTLDAAASDGTAAGGESRRSWRLLVTQPDADDDGWAQDVDCDDADADVNPGTFEVRGNGKDDDCVPASTDVVADLPPTGGTGSTLVSYVSPGWHYKQVSHGALPGFEDPAYDDSAFSTGPAAFSYGGCQANLLYGQTEWNVGTDMLIRREITLPAGTTGMTIGVGIDNDVQVWVNGIDVSGGMRGHNDCPTLDSFFLTVPDAVLQTGVNTIAARGVDWGGATFLDLQVKADLPSNVAPPGTTALTATATAGAHLVRDISWDLDTTASPSSWDLFAGDTGTSKVVVSADRTDGPSAASVDGQVCLTNSGTVPTDDLAGSVAIHRGQPATAVPGAVQALDVSGHPVLAAGASHCYPYDIAIPTSEIVRGQQYLAVADITITNHAVQTGAFGPQALATDGLAEDTPSPLSTVHVTSSDGVGPWTFTDDGSRTYPKTFSCPAAAGPLVSSATITETGMSADDAVEVHCHALQVSSSVTAARGREFAWGINKTGDRTTAALAANETVLAGYTVALTATPTDSGRAAGAVRITNPAPVPAVLTSVSELLGGSGVGTVSCGTAFPITLPADSSIACAFTSSVSSWASTTSVAKVVLRDHAFAADGTAGPAGTTEVTSSQPVAVADVPITPVDTCVAVTDNLQGALGTFCSTSASLSTSYSRLIGPYTTAGTTNVVNTATFTAADTGRTGSSTWTIAATTLQTGGCTLTVGYWKSHAGGGPQNDMVTRLLPISLGNSGGARTVVVRTPAAAAVILGIPDSSNGIDKLSAQLLGAKLNIKNGAAGTAITTLVSAADTFLSTRRSADWKSLSKDAKASVTTWATALESYNRGLTGPGHCS